MWLLIIPFSDSGFTSFEPGTISIPANMTVIWFNNDDAEHSVTVNTGNSTIPSGAAFDSDLIDPDRGSFFHQFTVRSSFYRHNNDNPYSF